MCDFKSRRCQLMTDRNAFCVIVVVVECGTIEFCVMKTVESVRRVRGWSR